MSLDVWKFVLSVTRLRRRTPIIRCSSGQPATHQALADVETDQLGSLRTTQTFICQGGVNTVRLLQLTRKTLFDDASAWGANALIDESWTCDIFRRRADVYEVRIVYEAGLAKAYKRSTGGPVAVQEAQGIPGPSRIDPLIDPQLYLAIAHSFSYLI